MRRAGAAAAVDASDVPVSKQFAIHEMGKALVATVVRQARESQGLKPRLERVERVSMVPRGRCAPLKPSLYVVLIHKRC